MSLSRSSISTRRWNGPIGGGAGGAARVGIRSRSASSGFPIEMLEIAGDHHQAGLRTPLALPEREHLIVGEALDVRSLAGDAGRKAVAGEERRRHAVVGARSRILVGVGNLPEDHGALQLQMGRIEERSTAHVGQQVDRRHRRFGSDHGPEHRVVLHR